MDPNDPGVRDDAVVLRVQVRGRRPPVWRRLVVHPDTGLEELHRLLSVLFEWDEGLEHSFQAGKVVLRPGTPGYDERRLSELAPRQVLVYSVGPEPIRCGVRLVSRVRARSYRLPILAGGMRRMKITSELDVYVPLPLDVDRDLRRFRRYDELVPDKEGKMVEPWQATAISGLDGPPGIREAAALFPGLLARRKKAGRLLEPVADKVPPGTPVDLMITLEDMPVPVWRLLRVGSDTSFMELHYAIQLAMGWDDSHLFEFSVRDSRIQSVLDNDVMDLLSGLEIIDASMIFLRDLLTRKGWSISYLYDFGDDWMHQVKAVKVHRGIPYRSRIELLDGAGACPPEDCGGAYGYGELVRAINDPEHPEHDELVEIFGTDRLDPEEFDIEAARKRLALHRPMV